MANQSATFNIGLSAKDYKTADKLGTYSGVIVWLSDDAAEQFTVDDIETMPIFTQEDEEGNETIVGYKSNPWSSTGRVLDVVNPFGTQAMATNILQSLRQANGIALNYSPFEAETLIPPNFEIGDAVSINGEHHGIYNFTSKASRLPLSTLQASADEEVDHEYPYKAQTKSRELTRKFQNIVSQFQIANGKIAAKVSQQGTDDDGTFGWSLTHRGFFINNGEVKADGTDLFSFTKNGLSIKGNIEADTGHIGGSGGFTIQSGKLYSGKSSFSSTANGVYIGTNGISLGSGFRVTSGGALTATSGTFGSLSVSNGNTWGTYYGGLQGCSGGGCSFNNSSLAGDFSGTGALNTSSSVGGKNIATYVGDIVANTITANYINAQMAKVSSLRLGSYTITVSGRNIVKSVDFQSETYDSEYIYFLRAW